jgi:hypothetical protein
MITEQVREIAHNLLSSRVLRDPRDLSLLVAAELERLDIVGADESAELINFTTLISGLLCQDPVFHGLKVDFLGEALIFSINRGRMEALFWNLLMSSKGVGAQMVRIQGFEWPQAWSFVIEDDGNTLSSSERVFWLDMAYEVHECGELKVSDLHLFTVQQIIRFYEGVILMCPKANRCSSLELWIPST